MITMTKKHEIIKLHLEGLNKSRIARELGVTRDTVRKYIKEYQAHEQELEKARSEAERESIILKVNAKPTYDTSKRKPHKVTDEIIARLETMIAENETLRKGGNRKLMRKRVDMHEVLMKEGHDISYRSVCEAVNRIVDKPKEAFIRQVVSPGEMVEFDWGEVTLTIDDIDPRERRFLLAVFTLHYSGHRFAALYTLENTASFNDAHVRYFEAIGGVPGEIVYDNAKTAVKRFVQRKRELSEALKRLKNYYGFRVRFTNPYSGHEKGAVERSVEFVRRRTFSGRQHFRTLAEAKAHLSAKVEELNGRKQQRTERSANTGLAEERTELLPSRVPLDTGVLDEAKVNKYSFIYVDSNFYSVPDHLVGKRVSIRKYPFSIRVLHKDRHILTHPRIYGKNGHRVEITHYIDTLEKKPGAIKRSLVLRESSDWLQKIYQSYYSTTPKEFVKLLELIKSHSLDRIKRAIARLQATHRPVKTDLVRQELSIKPPVEMEHPSLDITAHAKSQLTSITELFANGGVTHD